jgi:hypothetical protein
LLAFPLVAILPRLLVLRLFPVPGEKPHLTRSVSRWRWLGIETALPWSFVATGVGAILARFRFPRMVAEGELLSPKLLATHLALTLAVLAFSIGIASVTKTRIERRRGLVALKIQPPPPWPGPLLVGFGLAAATYVWVPGVGPELSLDAFVLLMGGLGFASGGLFAGLGGLRGARLPPWSTDPASPGRPPS